MEEITIGIVGYGFVGKAVGQFKDVLETFIYDHYVNYIAKDNLLDFAELILKSYELIITNKTIKDFKGNSKTINILIKVQFFPNNNIHSFPLDVLNVEKCKEVFKKIEDKFKRYPLCISCICICYSHCDSRT